MKVEQISAIRKINDNKLLMLYLYANSYTITSEVGNECIVDITGRSKDEITDILQGLGVHIEMRVRTGSQKDDFGCLKNYKDEEAKIKYLSIYLKMRLLGIENFYTFRHKYSPQKYLIDINALLNLERAVNEKLPLFEKVKTNKENNSNIAENISYSDNNEILNYKNNFNNNISSSSRYQNSDYGKILSDTNFQRARSNNVGSNSFSIDFEKIGLIVAIVTFFVIIKLIVDFVKFIYNAIVNGITYAFNTITTTISNVCAPITNFLDYIYFSFNIEDFFFGAFGLFFDVLSIIIAIIFIFTTLRCLKKMYVNSHIYKVSRIILPIVPCWMLTGGIIRWSFSRIYNLGVWHLSFVNIILTIVGLGLSLILLTLVYDYIFFKVDENNS